MKKWLPLLALLFLLAGCTGSCGGTEAKEPIQSEPAASPQASALPTPTPEPTAVPSETPATTPAPVETLRPTPTPEATPVVEDQVPTDEEVLETYRLAEEAFFWFQVAPMPFDPADSRTVDGAVYYRVDYPGIGSLDSLRGYLKGLFSDALVDTLLPYDGTQYRDIDGVLYVQDGGRGTDLYRGEATAQVVRGDNPNRLTVRVTVETVDPEQEGAVTGSVTYDFPYEKVGERWIFTDFSLVR